jgi:hypothetical protein
VHFCVRLTGQTNPLDEHVAFGHAGLSIVSHGEPPQMIYPDRVAMSSGIVGPTYKLSRSVWHECDWHERVV